jgi:hypothetical protein
MKTYDPQVDSIVDDPLGPLWYRGLAQEDETEEFGYLLDLILKRYDAKRIVIGHTPTGGVVWPRFDQRVVANDSGIAASYELRSTASREFRYPFAMTDVKITCEP